MNILQNMTTQEVKCQEITYIFDMLWQNFNQLETRTESVIKWNQCANSWHLLESLASGKDTVINWHQNWHKPTPVAKIWQSRSSDWLILSETGKKSLYSHVIFSQILHIESMNDIGSTTICTSKIISLMHVACRSFWHLNNLKFSSIGIELFFRDSILKPFHG